ncbi:Non-canonical non-ribosomal peptide synthetase FUB8 [Fulvia fulva]|nr:Non-canonical non-ribosomal peptide synthetase FUB8 [Fulvia fulva]KAK4619098.1 Non-canonical non-ribosomal peptide synthetase FUB8 [Fulvia fulva]WPV18358.1 Non-canonical non-ribosomal peptide synthetase FUB8 [Fulvia fulva]WPV32806.1 Non-canonical non-ribosomal peptide synthetase FUB8 [Fulvia fulva]
MDALTDFLNLPLPDYIDNLAINEPDRVFARVLSASSTGYSAVEVTVQGLAVSIDIAARWLDEQLGQDGESKTIAFMAAGQDLRYFIIMLGAVKSGRLAFFPSPRNDVEAQCSLFNEYRCKTLLLPRASSFHDKLQPVIEQLALNVLEMPSLHYFLHNGGGLRRGYGWMPEPDSDFKLQPLVGVHTSGATGSPKPVVVKHGNATAMEHWKRLPSHFGHGKVHFTHWSSKTILLALPLFHLAGLNIMMAALQNNTIVVLPPTGLGPLSSDIIGDVLGQVTADWLVTSPSILADMASDVKLSSSFLKVEGVAYGGGPLSKAAGDAIVESCSVLTFIGMSECGILPSQLVERDDWQYIQFSPALGIEMRPYVEGLHELSFVRDEAYKDFQVPFFTSPEIDEYSTKDLFSQHPANPDLWLWQGRTDDIIVYATGERFNPADFENTISGDYQVNAAILYGNGESQSALLVEPHRSLVGVRQSEREIIQAIWPTVEEANAKCPSYARVRRDMIVITDLRKPLPRAGKDTVQRKAALTLYEQELDALYSRDTMQGSVPDSPYAVEERKPHVYIRNDSPIDTHDDVSPDERQMMQQILDIVERHTDLRLHATDDFFAVGLDSIGVAGIVKRLRKLIAIHGDDKEMEPKTIYNHPTAAALARYLAGKELVKPGKLSSTEELYERYSFNPPVTTRDPIPYDSLRRIVALTGSTGSFGTYLLDRLLHDDTVTHIICLNRKHNAEAMQLQSLRSKGLQTNFKNKVTFLTVDFSKQYMSLDRDTYKNLLTIVTHILHTAWHVNFNLPLSHFEKPHIAGIRQLVDFSARSSHGAMIIFLSSVGAVSNYRASLDGENHRTVPEDPIEDWSCASRSSGYGQSKLVAERILYTAATEADVPCTIIRFGQIAGPSTGMGVWQKWEWLPSLVTSSKYLGCLPATLGAFDVVDWVPIDSAAKIVGEFLHDATTQLQESGEKLMVYHAVNPNVVAWDTLLPSIQPHLGVYDVVSSHEWVELLAESDEKGSPENPAGKLIPFYRSLVDSEMQVPLDITMSRQASRTLAELPSISGDLFESWVRKWIYGRPVILSLSPALPKLVPQAVFSGTGRLRSCESMLLLATVTLLLKGQFAEVVTSAIEADRRQSRHALRVNGNGRRVDRDVLLIVNLSLGHYVLRCFQCGQPREQPGDMSKFFRSADSSGSDTDSSDSDTGAGSTAEVSRDGALQSLSNQSHTLGPDILTDGKDWLLHSLLEERCLNQVRAEQTHARSLDDNGIRREARKRYRALVARLAPLNLVSPGLDDDRHGPIRQSVRDILDSVGTDTTGALQVAPRTPLPLRRMLTEGNDPVTPSSPISTILFDTLGTVGCSAATPRYVGDFEELGALGKGGYGEVFHVRHHLDQREYAVKKVPIRPAMVSRILAEGKSALDDVLAEVQTLCKLEHPNIVRYFSSWIEWSTPKPSSFEGSSFGLSSQQLRDVVGGAEVSTSFSHSLHRVRTESDGLSDNIFESRSHDSIAPSVSAHRSGHEESSSRSVTGAALERFSGPALTLHMQMDVYPMTLADFIAPKAGSSGILPLAHCFHLETSVRILLAILDGVEYLHLKNMIHRDLKPANIFLRHEDNPRATHNVDLLLCSECRRAGKPQPAKLSVRIGDFGLVTNVAEQIHSSPGAAGTELYRPKTMGLGPQLDIHAVGVIACELLYCFNTQMERKSILHALRDGHIPNRFTTCVGTQSNKARECIKSMLTHGNENVSLHEIKHRLSQLIAPPSFSALSLNDEVTRRSST